MAESEGKSLITDRITLKQIWANNKQIVKKKHLPSYCTYLLAPILLFGYYLRNSLALFVESPLSSLIFYALNLWWVYIPLLKTLNLKVTTIIAILPYLLVVIPYTIRLTYLRYVKGVKTILKEDYYGRSVNSFLFLAWIVGVEITLILDLFVIANFFTGKLL
jgi:hypothetical protein